MSINEILENLEENYLIAKHKIDKGLDLIETLKVNLREKSQQEPDVNFTADEVANYLKKSKQHIRNLTSQNKIPFVKIGSSTLYPKKEIDSWLRKELYLDVSQILVS